ncbi:MAG TPA: uroporphyrinogen-III synthase [Parasegetibacter sp.]|jgi:uroporphyrinogen-III synthase
MDNIKATILSTRPLEDSDLSDAGKKNILVECVPFIQTIPLNEKNIKIRVNELVSVNADVVFTSMNAVKAVAEIVGDRMVNWNVYAIEGTTSIKVTQLLKGVRLAATAHYGKELAEKIIRLDNLKEVHFFCGNIRRDELPDTLKAAGIVVNETQVYKTIPTPHSLGKQYNGILFFSPSGVESFFSANSVGPQTVLFAIGRTTAEAIQTFTAGKTTNKIIISNKPYKRDLISNAVEYFSA